jgi:hypothetical protein
MTRIIYLGLIALPVVLCHASKNVSISAVPIFSHNTYSSPIATNESYQTQFKPFVISARDDKIQDCLRFGNCKD